MSELQRMLDEASIEEGDRNRLARIEGLLRAGAPLRVAVHPGETCPPEYHVFIQDPDDMDAPLFAFVLAPEAVISEMLAEPPRLVFETATFQAMGTTRRLRPSVMPSRAGYVECGPDSKFHRCNFDNGPSKTRTPSDR